MERKTQNLFLFFEETDDEKDISSKLVLLYTNRFVICEDEQTEIIGVYNLAKTNANTSLISNNFKEQFEREPFELFCTETELWSKLKHDECIFQNLGSEIEPEFESYNARLMEFTDRMNSISIYNHFIIGSSFYSNKSWQIENPSGELIQHWINENYRSCYYLMALKYVHDIERLVHADDQLVRNELDRDNLIRHTLKNEFKRLEYESNIQNLITILSGSHEKLYTAEQVKLAHTDSEREFQLINEDLENFYTVIMSSSGKFREEFASKIDVFKCLSFYKQLTDLEFKKLKPEQDKMELMQQKWKTQELFENLLSLLTKSDPGYQYLHCNCQRYTVSMSRGRAFLKMHNDIFERH